MDVAIIVSIVTGAFTLTGVIITVLVGNSKTQYRLGKLEEKVDKHNMVQERVALNEQSIKALHKRIDRLDKEHSRRVD